MDDWCSVMVVVFNCTALREPGASVHRLNMSVSVALGGHIPSVGIEDLKKYHDDSPRCLRGENTVCLASTKGDLEEIVFNESLTLLMPLRNRVLNLGMKSLASSPTTSPGYCQNRPQMSLGVP